MPTFFITTLLRNNAGIVAAGAGIDKADEGSPVGVAALTVLPATCQLVWQARRRGGGGRWRAIRPDGVLAPGDLPRARLLYGTAGCWPASGRDARPRARVRTQWPGPRLPRAGPTGLPAAAGRRAAGPGYRRGRTPAGSRPSPPARPPPRSGRCAGAPAGKQPRLRRGSGPGRRAAWAPPRIIFNATTRPVLTCRACGQTEEKVPGREAVRQE